jgi:hypothetical protein
MCPVNFVKLPCGRLVVSCIRVQLRGSLGAPYAGSIVRAGAGGRQREKSPYAEERGSAGARAGVEALAACSAVFSVMDELQEHGFSRRYVQPPRTRLRTQYAPRQRLLLGDG